jgi:hypothetical protein
LGKLHVETNAARRIGVNRRDFASGLFWLGIAIFVATKALDLGFGEFSNPGSGFVLFWSSLVCGILSIALVIRAVLGTGGRVLLSELFRGLKWRKALITIAALFVYALFLTRVGFLLMTFGFMLLLFALGRVKPLKIVGGALVTSIVAYGIFHFVLHIPLPMGILGW